MQYFHRSYDPSNIIRIYSIMKGQIVGACHSYAEYYPKMIILMARIMNIIKFFWNIPMTKSNFKKYIPSNFWINKIKYSYLKPSFGLRIYITILLPIYHNLKISIYIKCFYINHIKYEVWFNLNNLF